MARTQAADYDKKREAITQHAARLFAQQGFAGASVAELATVCGVSKSLIYHYYASKEAILFDVMNEHMDALVQIAQDKTAEGDLDVLEELAGVTRALLECYQGAVDHQKILLYELSFLPPAERKQIVDKQRAVIERIESILARGVPAEDREHANLRAKTMLYFGMLNWTHTWFKASGPISRDELADEIASTTLKSLKP